MIFRCSTCKNSKSSEYFYRDVAGRKEGYAYSCKDCMNKRDAEYRKTEKYRRKVRRNKWKQQGINITYEQYEEMVESQNGRCAICKTDVNQFDKGFCVDHCHDTGKIRGLLCTSCNMGIGNLKDSAVLLRRAADYLESHHG